MTERRKVYIIEEKDYKIKECIPPNFLPYFECIECWNHIEALCDSEKSENEQNESNFQKYFLIYCNNLSMIIYRRLL